MRPARRGALNGRVPIFLDGRGLLLYSLSKLDETKSALAPLFLCAVLGSLRETTADSIRGYMLIDGSIGCAVVLQEGEELKKQKKNL